MIKFDAKLKIITHKTKNHHSGSPGPGGKIELNELNHHSSSPGLGSKKKTTNHWFTNGKTKQIPNLRQHFFLLKFPSPVLEK